MTFPGEDGGAAAAAEPDPDPRVGGRGSADNSCFSLLLPVLLLLAVLRLFLLVLLEEEDPPPAFGDLESEDMMSGDGRKNSAEIRRLGGSVAVAGSAGWICFPNSRAAELC